jgi:hypothetical protein
MVVDYKLTTEWKENCTFFETLMMECKFFMLIKSNDKPSIKSLNCEKRNTRIAKNTWKMIKKWMRSR